MRGKVRIWEMNPEEFRRALKEKPVVYLALGSLEFHGPQNPLGLDALKIHPLLEQVAEEEGGVVLPPLFWGARSGHTYYPGSLLLREDTLGRLLIDTGEALKSQGVRVFLGVSGHSPLPQVRVLEKVNQHFQEDPAIRVLLIRDWILVEEERIRINKPLSDHGGSAETSHLLSLKKELVNLKSLPPSLNKPLWGLEGIDPRFSSPEYGEEIGEALLKAIKRRVTRLLSDMRPLPPVKGRGTLRVKFRNKDKFKGWAKENLEKAYLLLLRPGEGVYRIAPLPPSLEVVFSDIPPGTYGVIFWGIKKEKSPSYLSGPYREEIEVRENEEKEILL